MSTLCAIDLAKALPEWGLSIAPASLPLQPTSAGAGEAKCPAVSLSCYTFGAPRTGNRAFARDFNAHVPDCFSIINGQDVGESWACSQHCRWRAGLRVHRSARAGRIVFGACALEPTSLCQHHTPAPGSTR